MFPFKRDYRHRPTFKEIKKNVDFDYRCVVSGKHGYIEVFHTFI